MARAKTAAEGNARRQQATAAAKEKANKAPSNFAAAREEITEALKVATPITEKAAIAAVQNAVSVALKYNLSRVREEDRVTSDVQYTHEAKHPSTDFDVALYQHIARAVGTRAYPTEGQRSRKMITFGDEQAIAETRFIFASATKLVWYAALAAHNAHYGKGAKRSYSWINTFCREAVKAIGNKLEAEHKDALLELSAADRTRSEAKEKVLDEYVEKNKELIKQPARGRSAAGSKVSNLAGARAAKEVTKASDKGGVEVQRESGKGRVRRAS